MIGSETEITLKKTEIQGTKEKLNMQRIALIGENSVAYVRKLLEIWNGGNCAVLLDWRIPPQAAVSMMREADVQICFIEKTFLPAFHLPDCADIRFTAFEKAPKTAVPLPDELYTAFQPNYSKEEAVVVYSSGTTGKSKGIILSHYAIQTNADSIIEYLKPTVMDCVDIVKTLSHSSSLVGELLVALKSGMRVLIGPTAQLPRVVLNRVAKDGVTILCVTPTLLKQYAEEYQSKRKSDLRTLRAIYVSGSVLDDKTYELAHRAFGQIPVYNVYELSEAGSKVAAQRKDCSKSNSVGKPIPGVKVQIMDIQGELAPQGKRGIIYVKTESRYSGYVYGMPKHLSLYQGWLNTGDVGYLDEYGELHVVDRIDDVIIIDSHKIYPKDVERAICDVSELHECVVTPVERNGETVLCCGYVSGAKIERDIKKRLRSKLLAYEIPKFFIQIPQISKTRTGKVIVGDVQAFLQSKMTGLSRIPENGDPAQTAEEHVKSPDGAPR